MMFMFIMMMFGMESIASPLTLENMGLYKDINLSIFETDKGFLLNSQEESKAVLFNEAGRILGQFDREGHGPGEFKRQFVLAVDDTGIHFCSNDRYISSFNHQLEPIRPRWKSLPATPYLAAPYGVIKPSGSIIVSLTGKNHLFAELKNDNGQWVVNDKLIPSGVGFIQNTQQMLLRGKRPLLHGNTAFISKMGVAAGEDYYLVDVVHNFMEQESGQKSSVVLAAEIDDAPVFLGLHAIIYNVVRTADGYIVELFTHMKQGGKSKRWHDHFTADGGFIKRVNMDGSRLLPVINGQGIFLLEDQGETQVITRIQ